MTLLLSSLIFLHGPIGLSLLGLGPAKGSPQLLPALMTANTIAIVLSVGAQILGPSMISDIVEESQAKSGCRSEGLVLFLDRLLLKVATVMRHLTLIYIPLASALSISAVLTWALFRIDKGTHDRNLAAIATRRAKPVE